MNKALSLIVPVYNMEKYLEKCLASVLVPEKAGCYEVIIVNDGSTDSSINIARKYETMYPSIFIVVDKENGGYGSCFNCGIAISSGKYVKMLDSDDMVENKVFHDYLDFLSDRDEDVILNGVEYLNDITEEKSIYDSDDRLRISGSLDNLNDRKLNNVFIHNLAIKRPVLSGCMCPENVLYSDTMISVYGLLHAKTIYSSGLSLYLYRVDRPGQSLDKNVSYSHYLDYAIVLNHVQGVIPKSFRKESNMTFILDKLEFLFYQFLLGALVNKENGGKEYFEEYRTAFKLFLHNRDVSIIRLKGAYVRIALLFGPSSYGILKLVSKIRRL